MKKKVLCVLLAMLLCFDSIEFSMPVFAQSLQQQTSLLYTEEPQANQIQAQEIELSGIDIDALDLQQPQDYTQTDDTSVEEKTILPVESTDTVTDDGAESTTITDGFLTYTITGSNAVVTACDSAAAGKIVIPAAVDGVAVTEIAAAVFENNHNITEVILDANIKKIGSEAFRNCSALVSVQIPASANVIDSYAFYDCVALQDVQFFGKPAVSYTTYNEHAYAFFHINNFNWTSAEAFCETFGGHLVTIADAEENAFVADTAKSVFGNITSFFIGATDRNTEGTWEWITGEAFSYTNWDQNEPNDQNGQDYSHIYIESSFGEWDDINESDNNAGYFVCEWETEPESNAIFDVVTTAADQVVVSNIGLTIGNYAFYNCEMLQSVSLAYGVTSLGNYVFAECSNLQNISLPVTLGAIGSHLLSGTFVTELVYPVALQNCSNSILSGSRVQKVTFTDGSKNIPAYACSGAKFLKQVEIPDSCTQIGDYAFYNCTDLLDITFTENLSEIGSYSFYNCVKLSQIQLPASLQIIHSYAFRSCSALQNIIFAENGQLKTIDSYAFCDCVSLQEVILPQSLELLGSSAFNNCYRLAKVELNDGLREIQSYAMANCKKLTQIYIPASVTTIGSYIFSGTTLKTASFEETTESIPANIFYGATALESVSLPESLKSIGESAFRQCTNLSSIVLPEGLQTIGNHAFRDCTRLQCIALPASLNRIGASAFQNCENMTAVTFADDSSLDTIDNYAFYACRKLTEIELPDSVRALGSYVFSNDYNLTAVTLNEGLKTIGAYAFNDCISLTEITIPSTVESMGSGVFSGQTRLEQVIFADGTQKVPENALRDATWVKEVVLPDSVTEIGPRAFYSCNELESFTWPAKLKTIGDYAFAYCSFLQEITMPEMLETIGAQAFANCTNLKTVTLNEELMTIGSGAFTNCVKLEAVAVPKNVQTIGSAAFRYCSSLKTVTFSDRAKLQTIESEAFASCTSLETICLPASLTGTGSNIFNACTKLTTVSFADDTVDIPSHALYGANYVQTVVLPATVKTIGTYAFYGCSKLQNINLPSRLRTIGERAFYACAALTDISMEAVESIGQYAFYNCENLATVDFGSELNTVGYYAFGHCYSLPAIDLPSSVRTVSGYAFANCPVLKDIFVRSLYIKFEKTAFVSCVNLTVYCDSDSDAYTFAIDNDLTHAELPSEASLLSRVGAGLDSLLTRSSFDSLTQDVAELFPVVAELPAAEEAVQVADVQQSMPEETTEDEAVVAALPVESDVQPEDIAEPAATDAFDEQSGLYYNGNIITGVDSSVKTLVIPATLGGKTVKSIANYAFDGNTKLESVVLPETLFSIGEYAFRNCTSLQSVSLNDDVKIIGYRAFYGCLALTEIEIPTGILSSNSEIFASCTRLRKVTFKETGANQIPSNILNNCPGVETVVIPDTVTTIQSYAFNNCPALGDVELPEALMTIESYAFANCKYLTTISVPASVFTIGESAFRNCTKLKTVKYAENANLNVIDADAFRGCELLTSFTAPENLYRIGSSAFYGCSGLEEITLNENLGVIDGNAFQNCIYLRSVTIPAHLISFSENVFKGCTRLTTVTFAQGTTQIPANVFYGCESITEITLPDTILSIGDSAFRNCKSLANITFPETLLTIGNYSFAGCTMLKKITLPERLYIIGESAFNGCTKLSQVDFAETGSLVTMGVSAFNNCDSLEEITLPAGLVTIREGAFRNCDVLENVIFNEDLRIIEYRAFENCTRLSEITIPAGLYSMGSEIFKGCTKLAKVIFAEGSLHIPNNALYNCASVETVFIPETVETIGNEAFRGCSSLQEISLNNIRSVGSYAFYACSMLKEVVIPASLMTMGDHAFANCTKLDDITIEAGLLTTLPTSAFENCSALETITIPASVSTISEAAFRNCVALKNVTLPEGLNTIGYRAFYGDTALEEITIPSTVKSSGSEIFRNANNLETVTFADGMVVVPQNMLNYSQGVTNVVLPATVEKIDHYAFANCSALTAVSLPEKVTYVGEYAFSNCDNLSSVVIAAGNPTVLYRAFYNCKALETFSLSEKYASTVAYGNKINPDAFVNCNNLTNLMLGNSLVEFDESDPLTIRYNGHIYTLTEVPEGISWSDANDICMAQGAHLVTVTSRGEEFIIEYLTRLSSEGEVWINGTDEDKEGVWTYTNGEDFTYSKWDSGQPDNYNNEEDYLCYGFNSYYWNDYDAAQLLNGFICEWDGVPGRQINLKVLDASGNDVTADVDINWYKQGVLATKGATLRNYDEEKAYSYEILLNEDLGTVYFEPARQIVRLTEDENVIVFTLQPIETMTAQGYILHNDGTAINHAELSFEQVINGKYSATVQATTDENGYYTVDLLFAPTSVTISADEFYSKTVNGLESSFGSEAQVTFPVITLKPLTASRITLLLNKQSSNADGTATVTAIENTDDLQFSLFNVTTGNEITQFVVQYPYIVLDAEACAGLDVLRLSITHTKNTMIAPDCEIELDENMIASVTVTFIENGKIDFTSVAGNCAMAFVFNSDGSIRESIDLERSSSSSAYPDGEYTIVLIEKTDVLRRIASLQKLTEIGLTAGVDYTLVNVTVTNGKLTVPENIQIPQLDETKLYYTIASATNLTASRYSLAQGKLLTLKAEYEIDSQYPSEQEYVSIVLPDDVAFIDGSVTFDGILSDYIYTAATNTVKVYTHATEGVIRCSVAPTATEKTIIDAYLGFVTDEQDILQPIGSVELEISALSFVVPEKTARKKIQLSGSGFSSSTIKIYDGDNLIGTTTSNKNGSWVASVELPVDTDAYSQHSIYAVLTSDTLGYSVKSDTRTLIYDPDYVNLSKITMINTAHLTKTCEFVTEIDFLNPTSETLSYNYWPSYPTFTFKVEFTTDNPDLISDVYVVTRNAYGDITYVPTAFDEQLGIWVGKQDYRNSKAKPAAVTAVYTYNEPERASLLVPQLAQYADILTSPVMLREYFSDSSGFSKLGMFGYGWTTGYDTKAAYVESEKDGQHIIVIGPHFSEVLEKQENGSFVGLVDSSVTGELLEDGIAICNNDEIYRFDNNGKLIGIEMPGESFSIEYENERPARITSSTGESLTVYYENGLAVKIVSSQGEEVVYTYDSNYLIRATGSFGTVEYAYNVDSDNKSKNALCEITTENGQQIFYTFDSYGRVISHYTDNQVAKVDYTYTSNNSVTAVDASGFSVDYVFDDTGKLTSYADSAGLSYTAEYGEDNLVDALTFADGTQRNFNYDANRNLISSTTTTATETISSPTIQYDESNRLITVVDTNGNSTLYEWNENGQIVKVTYADGTTEECTYDENGMLISTKTRSGYVRSYEYDSNNVLTKITDDANEYATTKDEENNTVSLFDGEKETKLQFDQDGNCVAVYYPDGKSLHYTYDATGKLTSMTDAEGYKSNYLYNANGQLVKVTDANGKRTVEYVYNADASLAKQINANGTYTTYTYKDGRLSAINNYAADNTLTSFFNYQTDVNGNILSMTDMQGEWKYAYDSKDQVIQVIQPDGTVIDYTYDNAGNRLTETVNGITEQYTSNSLNQYTQIGEKTYTYDLNGNLLTETDGATTKTYTYDTNNKLLAVSDGTNLWEYGYDIFGNRNKVTYNGETTEFVWSPVGNGNIVTAYTAGGSVVDYVMGNSLTAAVIDGETYFYNYDVLGSTAAITDPSGAVANTYTYTADGKITSQTGNTFNMFTFGGQYGIVDDNSGLYSIRARYLHVCMNRFTSPDPAGQSYDYHLYRYAGNNFVCVIDVDGELGVLAVLLIGAGVGVASELLGDATSTLWNGATTGDWSWAGGSLGDSLASYAAAGITGSASAGLMMLGVPPVLAESLMGGAKSILESCFKGEPIDWGDVLWEAALGGISEMIPGIFESKGGWFNPNTDYKAMLKRIWNGENWRIGPILKRCAKKILFDLENSAAGIFDWFNDIVTDGIKDLLDLWWGIIFGIDDPSGYIYEAVRSNRIEGVTVTAYTQESYYDDYGELQTDIVFWDATEFDQVNPLISNIYGQYAWDVPTGKWQVKYEKEGYETTYSEWLDVPPPQTEVNIGMISTLSPTVETINAYNDCVELVFSQYMDLSTVNTDNITFTVSGKKISGSIVPTNAEEGGMDPSVSYASRFVFTPDKANALKESVSVRVDNVVNYAGTEIEKPAVIEQAVVVRPKEIATVDSVSVENATVFEVKVALDIGKEGVGRVIDVISASPSIVNVLSSQVVIGADGTATVVCSSKLPGSAELIFTVSGTTLTTSTKVDVRMPNSEQEAPVEPEVPTTLVIDESTGLVKKTQSGYLAAHANTTVETLLTTTNGAVVLTATGEAVAADALVTSGMQVALRDGNRIVDSLFIIVLGDVSGDGVLSSNDARTALRVSVNLDTVADVYYEAARVNGTSGVSASDARSILRASVSLDDYRDWMALVA